MKLNYITQGSGQSVVLMHGMFGSLSNLGVIGRALADQYQVIAVDMRNHGESPHSMTMDYPAMAADIVELLDDLALHKAHLLGHSMGGKVAMQVALNQPDRVASLIAADIAPVAYRPDRHGGVLAGLSALAEARPGSRQQADRLLAQHVSDPGVRAFLLKNLHRAEDGHYDLLLYLDGILANYDETLTLAPTGAPFPGPTLFIKGADSAYIQEKHRAEILRLFPHAQLKVMDNTGHWLHAEKPDTFNRIVVDFLAEATKT
ncbi:alpha/beta fold hydrolase [Porticoccus sp.]|uniref:alpha/beta fold hydrolase n=1 Tax=Porticoccus sp. TaxID=2024853 RepID=UPI003F6A5309